MLKPSDVLTNQEREELLRRSDVIALAMVITTRVYLCIVSPRRVLHQSIDHFVGMAGAARRQLSLSVLMHEAGHGSLFRTRALNPWLGQWLCALPTLGDLHSYARGHQAHHRLAVLR